MSISLPNGTLLAAPSSSQPPISAAVTRILHLANFSPECVPTSSKEGTKANVPHRLKTRDIQNIFKEWETEKGGFRIKWRDDVNAMVVFVDANVGALLRLSDERQLTSSSSQARVSQLDPQPAALDAHACYYQAIRRP